MRTFDEYSKIWNQTASYPHAGQNIVYPALGLCGEAGEVAEKIKKTIRDDKGIVTPERKLALLKELGDVLWYVNAMAIELGLSLEDVAAFNVTKLTGRLEKGTLHGSGDDR